jgi:hypothetical protein
MRKLIKTGAAVIGLSALFTSATATEQPQQQPPVKCFTTEETLNPGYTREECFQGGSYFSQAHFKDGKLEDLPDGTPAYRRYDNGSLYPTVAESYKNGILQPPKRAW